MSASIELLAAISHKPEPGFMDESGGLECLARGFVGHFVSGDPSQVIIYQCEQFIGRLGVALLYSLKNARYVAHAGRMSKLADKRQPVDAMGELPK
jgi:hypothetical protein